MAQSGLKMAVAGIAFGVPAALRIHESARRDSIWNQSQLHPAVFTVVTLIFGLVAVAAQLAAGASSCASGSVDCLESRVKRVGIRGA